MKFEIGEYTVDVDLEKGIVELRDGTYKYVNLSVVELNRLQRKVNNEFMDKQIHRLHQEYEKTRHRL